jgi:hypothetical protein
MKTEPLKRFLFAAAGTESIPLAHKVRILNLAKRILDHPATSRHSQGQLSTFILDNNYVSLWKTANAISDIEPPEEKPSLATRNSLATVNDFRALNLPPATPVCLHAYSITHEQIDDKLVTVHRHMPFVVIGLHIREPVCFPMTARTITEAWQQGTITPRAIHDMRPANAEKEKR